MINSNYTYYFSLKLLFFVFFVQAVIPVWSKKLSYCSLQITHNPNGLRRRLLVTLSILAESTKTRHLDFGSSPQSAHYYVNFTSSSAPRTRRWVRSPISVLRHRLPEHATSHNAFLLTRAPSRFPPTTTWKAKLRFQAFSLIFKEMFPSTLANSSGHVNGGESEPALTG